MITSPSGCAFIETKERCVLRAYADPKTGGAPWTCGIGCTGADIGPTTVWTRDYADLRFSQDLAKREDTINDKITVPLTQGQFDALVSILYNVGYGRPGPTGKDGIFTLKDGRPSTLVRKLNAGDYAGAADQFPLWCSPGSNVENGLKIRRAQEREMFLGRAA